MQAFDYDRLPFFQARRLFIEIAVTTLEFEPGQMDVLSLMQGIDLLVEQLHINGPQGFEIIFALFIARRILPVQEIIIQRTF